MYFMVNATGIVLAVNPFGAEQLDYTVDELVGHTVLKVFYEPDREMEQAHAVQCLKQLGHSFGWELRAIRKGGSVLWVRETAREQKLQERELKLRRVLDLTPQNIAVLGPDGSPLYINRIGLEYFGINIDQWRAAGSRLDRVHPDDREHFASERIKRLREGEPYEFEARMRRHDGEFRYFLSRRNPLKDERGH
jgi:PAS domain S-box-containing protein